MSNQPADSPPRETHGAGGQSAENEAVAKELLQRASRGDEAAFGQLYDLLASRVYGLVLRVVRDPAQSEEVAQEIFIEVWRQSTRYDPSRGSVVTWVLTMAHRRAVDRVRSAESSRQRDTAYETKNLDRDVDSVVESVERNFDQARVRKALDHLTDVQRSAIELAYFGGYTHSEVATMLDLPLGTAKTRIRDGLIRLRDALGVAV